MAVKESVEGKPVFFDLGVFVVSLGIVSADQLLKSGILVQGGECRLGFDLLKIVESGIDRSFEVLQGLGFLATQGIHAGDVKVECICIGTYQNGNFG